MSRKAKNERAEHEITDSVILEFLNAQSGKTRITYASSFQRVLEFSKGESGQHMLEDCAVWSRKIMAFQQWMISKGYALTTVENHTGMVRGFFTFYKKPSANGLDLSQQDKNKLGRKARSTEDYSFTLDDLKKLDAISSLEEKYVLRCGLSFGLRAEDFAKLTYGKYRIALEKAQKENVSVPIPLGKVNTEKENEVYAYPFISADALPIIQAMLDANKTAKDEERVFVWRNAQLTSTLQKLVFKCGIETHGEVVRFHCLRKKLYDSVVSVASTVKGDQIIGHKLKGETAPYVGVGSLHEVYERAFPSFSVTNGNGQVVKAKVSALEEKAKSLEEENAQLKAELAELRGENEQNFTRMFNAEKTLKDLMTLPTIKKELFNRKEKVEV